MKEEIDNFHKAKHDLLMAIGETRLMKFLVRHYAVVMILGISIVIGIYVCAFLGIIPTEHHK